MNVFFPAATLLIALLLSVGGHAAQDAPAKGQLAFGVDASDDSDAFHEFKPWSQYEAPTGWGLRAGWQRYSRHGWSANGGSLYLTHRIQQGALTGNGRLGLNRTASHSHVVGVWDGMYQFTPSTAAGLSLERDVVNSQKGLVQGLTATSTLAVLDHQFHPRLSLGLAGGSTWFSDHNRRDVLRSRWTLTLSETQGWYTYAMTRHYRNSDPYQGAYFAPERFREAALGLMWKKALSSKLVVRAYADAGRQYIDGQGQRLWHWGLYLSAPHHAPVQWSVGVTTSRDNASSITSSEGDYRYTSLTAQLRIPM